MAALDIIVVSEVPLTQFTATLRESVFPPDMTAFETTCALTMLLLDHYI